MAMLNNQRVAAFTISESETSPKRPKNHFQLPGLVHLRPTMGG